MDEKVVDQQYLENPRNTSSGRTEQLRAAVTIIDELVVALKPFRPEIGAKTIETLQNGLTKND